MKKQHKKVEWSKLATGLVMFVFGIYGLWSGIEYYKLVKLAIQNNTTMPDATLPVACVTTIIAALLSYALYHFGLKNSRNKYGVDENGEPYKKKISSDK